MTMHFVGTYPRTHVLATTTIIAMVLLRTVNWPW